MKRHIAIFFLLCGLLSNVAFAQDNNDEDTIFSPSEKMPCPDDEIKLPEFPGGNAKVRQFISENISYPRYAEKNRIEGRVIVSFVVQKDGSIAEIEVMDSPHELLSEEAVRVVKLMPNWIPGECKGEPAKVQFVLPIVFKLWWWQKIKKKKNQENNLLTMQIRN